MVGSRRLLKAKSYLPLAAGIAAFLTLSPSKIRYVDARGLALSPVSIKVDRLSPAFAALEDARQISFDPFLLDEASLTIPSETEAHALVAGVGLAEEWLHPAIEETQELLESTVTGLSLANSTVKKATGKAKIKTPVKPIRLAGLKVSQNSEPSLPNQEDKGNEDQMQLEHPQVQVEPSLYNNDGNLKPLNTRKNELKDYYKNQEWASSVPTLQQRARALIQKELAKKEETKSSDYKWIPSTASSEGIIVGKPTEDGKLAKSVKSGNHVKKTYSAPHTNASAQGREAAEESDAHQPVVNQKVASSEHTSTPAYSNDGRNKKMETALAEMNEARKSDLMKAAAIPKKYRRPMTLKGDLQITGGLAFTGETFLTLKRTAEGVTKESGKIWIRDAAFEIWVKEPVGYLVAELRARSGELLGRGELDLYKMSQPDSHEVKVSDLTIKLEPAVSGAQIDTISAHSFGYNREVVKDAEVYIDALGQKMVKNPAEQFEDKRLLGSSSFIVRAVAKNHWGTLAVGLSESVQDVRLFPNSMMEALFSIAEEQQGLPVLASQNQAVIWGRVTENGQPVSGATVELAGDYSLEPIYFNSLYLPDKTLKKTGPNGLFAYVTVTPGIHSVRANYKGRYFPARVLPVQARHVSYASLEMDEMRTANIKVYDAMDTAKTLPAIIDVMGAETQYEVDGEANIQYSSGSGLMMIEADAGEPYEVVRLQASRQAKSLKFPMVRSDWLQSVITQKRMNVSPGRGVVVGFVDGSDFEVFLDEGIEYSKQNIAYFDAEGQILRKSRGVAGGGFILFNVPSGYRSVHILPEKDEKFISRVLVAEPSVINVLDAQFKP